jgi:arylsulfatase A
MRWSKRLVLFLGVLTGAVAFASERPPNFVLIYCDDLGYGDLGSYGHPTIRTPELDRMAAEGQRWTQFYSPDAVCTPSRAGLLTGRYPVRYGLSTKGRGVLFPDSASGLPDSEETLAQALKKLGYVTACVGKWHLGHLPEYLPTNRGFDSYFGIPYSNDMDRVGQGSVNANIADTLTEDFKVWNVPILRNTEEIERPADQRTITRRYTDEAKAFIRESREKPFFLYLAHSMPHIPLFRSEEFKGRSQAGIYGDVIEEMDASTGEIRRLIEELGIAENTLVVFTSDNGPWLMYRNHGGSAGPLRDGKGTTWEGGQRVPAIFWWPGRLAAGVRTAVGGAVDLFPTLVGLAGGEVSRPLDGQDLSPVLLRGEGLPRERMFFWSRGELMAVREGPWKAHFITKDGFGQANRKEHEMPLLFHLDEDIGERYDLAAGHPEIVQRLRELRDEHLAGIEEAPDRLAPRIGQ